MPRALAMFAGDSGFNRAAGTTETELADTAFATITRLIRSEYDSSLDRDGENGTHSIGQSETAGFITSTRQNAGVPLTTVAIESVRVEGRMVSIELTGPLPAGDWSLSVQSTDLGDAIETSIGTVKVEMKSEFSGGIAPPPKSVVLRSRRANHRSH